ncbi:MAG: transposase, partial [Actinomycetota bacterium]|nr:transposase [Actinomycetota bacterium]
MKKDMSKRSKQELTDAIRQRYATASKQEKSRILDEFVYLTGYHRKHAIRVLGSNDQLNTEVCPVGRRIYDEATKEALIVIWEASDRICGKRPKAALPILVES